MLNVGSGVYGGLGVVVTFFGCVDTAFEEADYMALSRQLTVGEKAFVGVIDTEFKSEHEKRVLKVEKLERCALPFFGRLRFRKRKLLFPDPTFLFVVIHDFRVCRCLATSTSMFPMDRVDREGPKFLIGGAALDRVPKIIKKLRKKKKLMKRGIIVNMFVPPIFCH